MTDLQLCQVNANCFNTLKWVVVPGCKAHVIACQELKLSWRQLHSAQVWARRNGWFLFALPCLTGPSGGPSAGVGIMFRANLDANTTLIDMPTEVVAGRVIAVPLRTSGMGVIVVYSVYLHSGKGMDSDNFDIIQKISDHLNIHGRPFVMMGDWQNKPHDVAMAFKAHKADFVQIFATEEPTYIHTLASSTIDFYAVDSRISSAFHRLRVQRGILSPHSPVLAALALHAFECKVLTAKKPPNLPVDPPIGPKPPPPSWDDVAAQVSEVYNSVVQGGCCVGPHEPPAIALPSLLDSWMSRAGSELMDVLGKKQSVADGLGKPMTLVTRSLSDLLSVDSDQKVPASKICESLAGRLVHLSVICGRAGRGGPSDPPQHALDPSFIICKIFDMAKNACIHTHVRHAILALPLFPFLKQLRVCARASDGDTVVSHVQTLRVWAAWMRKEATQHRATELSNTRASFKAFAVDALTTNLAKGFAFSRPPSSALPKPVEITPGQLSVSPLARLNDMVGALSKIWKASDIVAPPLDVGPPSLIPLLPPPTADHVEAASLTFKRRTARVDGWHPRHYGHLSKIALTVLAQLIYIFEAVGDLPVARRLLKLPLIEQDADNGWIKLRLICLYVSFVRLWGRVRRPIMKKWEDANVSDHFFVNSTGTRITDTVWRSAVANNHADKSSQFALDAQGDLRKCFEHVDHLILWQQAKHLGYPLSVLRLSIATYRWPRAVQLGSISSPPIYPTCGTVAGSTGATLELKVYCVVQIRGVNRRNPTVRIAVMVDDFLLGAVGSSALEVLLILHAAFVDLIDSIEVRLKMQFASDKFFVVSNCQSLARRMLALLAPHSTTLAPDILRLGVPFGGGKKLSSKAQNIRVGAACRRNPRISTLARASGISAGRLFYGGTMPAASYGSEVVGMSKANTTRLCSAAASSLILPRGTFHCPIAWSVISKGGTVFPAATLNAGPAVRYALELWETTDGALKKDSTLSLPFLVEAFEKQLSWLDAASRTNAQIASSPIALAICSFRAAGFRVIDPVTISSSEHGELNLLLGSPALLKQYLVQGFMSCKLLTKVQAKLDGAFSPQAVVIKEHGLWITPAAKLYHSKAKYSLSRKQKRYMLKFFTDKVVTGTVLQRWGYATDGCCPFCGCRDTTFHRIFLCPHFDEQRALIVPRWLLTAAIAAGETSLLFSKGWHEVPSHLITAVQPDDLDFEVLVGPDCSHTTLDHPTCTLSSNLPTHGDGSCLRPSHPLVARAGFSLAQFDADDNHIITIRSPVPRSLPQTAAVAERLAVLTTNRFLDGPTLQPFVGDCLGALNLILHPLAARHPKVQWASLSRQMLEVGLKLSHALWVKAHTVIGDDDPPDVVSAKKANAHVDTHAKAAAASVEIPSGQLNAYGATFKRVTTVLRVAARMLELWPPGKELYGSLDCARATAQTAKVSSPHTFLWDGKSWLCVCCLRRKFSPKAALDRIPCVTLPPYLTKIVASPNGHRLLITSDQYGKPYLFCARCGYYACTAAKKLKDPCIAPGLHGVVRPRPASLKALFAAPSRHPLHSDVLFTRAYHSSAADVLMASSIDEVRTVDNISDGVAHENPPIPGQSDLPRAAVVSAGFDQPEWDTWSPHSD